MCVLQCWTHPRIKKKATLRRGLFLFTPHCSTQEQDGQIQRPARRSPRTKARMHRPWRPLRCAILPCWIPARSICSACAAKSFISFLFHPPGVFKTHLSCMRRSSHAMYSNVFNLCNSDSFKIGLHACACDVWVRILCAETIRFRSVWQRISEYFYFSRTLDLPPPSTFTSLSVVIVAISI